MHFLIYRGNKIYHPVIITGDFNSQPNSNVYKLMANGRSNGQNFRIPRELNITGKIKVLLVVFVVFF